MGVIWMVGVCGCVVSGGVGFSGGVLGVVRVVHLEISSTGVFGRSMWFQFVSKLDDGKSVQHGSSDTSRTRLSAAASDDGSWTIALWMPMGADGSGDDDYHEQCCYDARDRVEDDHGDGGGG